MVELEDTIKKVMKEGFISKKEYVIINYYLTINIGVKDLVNPG